MAHATSTIEARKVLPRKSVRVAQLSINPEPPAAKDKEVIGAPTQTKPTKGKEKAQKQVATAKPVEAK